MWVQIENMTDEELKEAVEHSNLFSKLSPIQKQRVVEAMQENGHTVGYMGDGINDTPALRQADVGISRTVLLILQRNSRYYTFRERL